jgi:phospholipase C
VARPPLEHVVVLMMENRSFDHMLGLLDHPGLPKATDPNEVVPNPRDPANQSSDQLVPFPLSGYKDLQADPKHGFPDVMRQLTGTSGPWGAPYDPKNNGFAWNYEQKRQLPGEQALGCYPPGMLPALSTLACEFAVCSRWFCSIPSETWPNRLYAHTATSDGEIENAERPYFNRTIFEVLSDARPKRSWEIFVGDIPQVAVFPTLFFHDGEVRFSRLNAFFERARAGRLPNYSFIEPRHFGSAVQSQHPLSQVLLGERLIADVYAALTADWKAWLRTLLLITYDEHGGFYDRVLPEPAVPDKPGLKHQASGFAFDLLGPRVPTVAVSPWIDRHTVDSEVHDHSSIIATLREAFDLEETLTDRDRAATGVVGLLDREEPRDPVPPPPVPQVRAAAPPEEWAEGVGPDGRIELNDLQQQLVRMAQRIDRETPPPPGTRGLPDVPAEPPPEPPFYSEAEIGEFVEAFRRRQMERM